jgi:hypothetical protein
VLPVPNPQHGPKISLACHLEGRANRIHIRVFTQALTLAAQDEISGSFQGWAKVSFSMPQLSAATYFIEITASNSLGSQKAKIIKLVRLP